MAQAMRDIKQINRELQLKDQRPTTKQEEKATRQQLEDSYKEEEYEEAFEEDDALKIINDPLALS